MDTNTIEPISGNKILLYVNHRDEQESFGWILKNRGYIEDHIAKNGALLIRGLAISDAKVFSEILISLFGEELSAYGNRSTPRTELKNNIYTATEYHSSETIPQHNENSYSNSWPMRIGFLCMVPATEKGNTPIADSRIVYQEIPREIRQEFEAKKVMYVRNYSKIDLPWQEVFQTTEKKVVEKYCEANNIILRWTTNGMQTKQITQASILHPVTKENLWFNQAHLFHVSNLEEELREGLIALLGIDNIPRNAYYGDGTTIEDEVLSIIRQAYEKVKFSFQWEKQDLLLLDNMLFTHGREPFVGSREILVGMAREYNPTA